MSDDRKYKQRGYQEFDGRPAPPPQGLTPGGKRMPVITDYKETVRCAECGHDLTTLFDFSFDSSCPRCRSDLHTCRNCRHFDTSARFECDQPLKERVSKKGKANRCHHFAPRTIVVKEISAGGPAASSAPRSDDARKALENLFKK